MNLFSKLSINQKIEENVEKISQLVSLCLTCQSKKAASNFGSQQKITDQKSKFLKNPSSVSNPTMINNQESINQSSKQLPLNGEQNTVNHQNPKLLSERENNKITQVQSKLASLKIPGIQSMSNLQNDIDDEPNNIFKSNISPNKADKSDLKTYSNIDVIANFSKKPQTSTCQCLYALQNYQPSKLGLTYLCYVRFPDGANSLLKAENFWNVESENPISLNILLKNQKVKLNESLGLILVIKNNLTQEVDLIADETSFKFKYSIEDKNFGSLVLENKISRNIYIAPMNQDSISFFFMPIKCGIVELEQVSFFDQKSKKQLVFTCHYKILIN